jgi:O-antigen/teichoic acid export membrane protein
MRLKFFAKDVVVYGVGNIGLRTASLLLTPVYTYCLSMEDFGLWATLQITIQAMLILMNVGMRTAFIRFAKECDESHQSRELLGSSTLIVLAGGAVVTAASTLLLPLVFRSVVAFPHIRTLVLLTCGAALAQSLSIQIMSYYRAYNRSGRFISVGLAGSFLLLISTLVAVYIFDLRVWGALLAYLFTYATLYVSVALDVFPKAGFRVSRRMFRSLCRFGAPLIFSEAGQAVIYGVSLYVLGYSAGLETVAVFSLGYKFATLMAIGVFLPFQLAFQPFVYANLNEPAVRQQTARLLTYLVLATTICGFVIIVGARILLPLVAPPAYAGAFIVMLWMLPAEGLIGLHYFGETLLGAVRRTSILGALNSTCGAICVVLSLVLIPRFGWYGAIMATITSAIIADSIELSIGIRQFQLWREIEWVRLFLISIAFVAQLAVAFTLRHAPIPLFLGGMAAFSVVGLALLYLGPFWTMEERIALKGAAGRMGSRLVTREISS